MRARLKKAWLRQPALLTGDLGSFMKRVNVRAMGRSRLLSSIDTSMRL